MNEQGPVMSFKCTYIAIVVLMTIQHALLQTTDKEWFDRFLRTGEACKSNTCRLGDSTCECYLTIDHALTMMYRGEGQPAVLLKPLKGKAVRFDNETEFERSLEDTFILADGYKSRIVIVVNGRFPGPTITAMEGQEVIVHVRNLMHTDSTTIHWHGLHQKKSPWSDGVAFVTQCPILPGQNYTYKFNAKPFGTSFYHAHIGDQRTMGLYGPLIILPTPDQQVSLPQEGDKVFVAIIQDWNHDDDEDALYQKMLWGVYDSSGNLVDETVDPSGARYSRFKCHSGLINGERIDFLLNADEPPGTYLLVAETLEVYSENEYHAAEAIIHYKNADINPNPRKVTALAAYAQPDLVDYTCEACNASTICECTYAVTIDNDNKDRVYQFVITNIGGGAGWSHPVHLHGHSFYVMKMVFATYDSDGKLMQNGTQDNIDIICPDSKNFCSDAKWRNESWVEGKHPDLNWINPPQKDTIIIPTGGYVIIRFKADNPGVWFFHCHIDLHNTNGMGMIINESPKTQPKVPTNFPKCKSFETPGNINSALDHCCHRLMFFFCITFHLLWSYHIIL
ncbi:unnamed protein product [Mytilus edulis]|uniref:Uncharacterized protein n=1 Tax=Mytilus edulis TaxID=6550 RepID=A0A8S3U462_MYTED|nr:unnamed protein product [Mytilus edulis]